MSTNFSTIQLNFGKNLQQIRKRKGLSQLDLAIACNLEKTAISRIENGRTNITIKTMEIIANALEIHPKKLFDFEF